MENRKGTQEKNMGSGIMITVLPSIRAETSEDLCLELSLVDVP